MQVQGLRLGDVQESTLKEEYQIAQAYEDMDMFLQIHGLLPVH